MSRERVDERPFVAVRDKTHPCIVIWRARRYVYAIEYERGIRVSKINAERFDRDYELLHPHVNGSPDEAKEYDVQAAARKYLDWGSYAGMTEVAERALQTIVNRDGSVDMSDIEKTTATQGDVKVPTPAALGDALAAVTPKKASTKNGTTPEAKRASKAQVTKTKESDVAKPAAKKEAPTKKAAPAKKEAPAKKLTTKAPAKAKEPSGRGRPSSLDPTMTIRVVAEENPRREGSQGHANWAIIARYNGKTVGKYLAADGNSGNLLADIARGHVKLVK